MKAAVVGLTLFLAFGTSGCATLLYPERALVPADKRGDLDTPLVVADVILSVPFLLAGFAALALGGGHPDILESFMVPLWLDRRQGTLWHPKVPE